VRAVADYVDSDGPIPGALHDAFRLEKYGAPFAGGWTTWPLKWFMPVQIASNTYDTLTAVNRAMSRLDGEALDKWRSENGRLINAALTIQQIRDELEQDGE
jgi:hypothetical protein